MAARRSGPGRGELLTPRVGTDSERHPLDVASLEDDAVWEQCDVGGGCVGAEQTGLEILESVVRSFAFTASQLDRLRATDTVFDACELSGALFEHAALTRVEFRSCRMTGFTAPALRLHDVRFVDCRLDEASLRMCRGDRVRFESTSLRSADLFDAELRDTQLLDCDLTGAELSQARLPGARLHGSTIEHIRGADGLRGVVIDSTQILPVALQVLGSLGIVVDDDRPLT